MYIIIDGIGVLADILNQNEIKNELKSEMNRQYGAFGGYQWVIVVLDIVKDKALLLLLLTYFKEPIKSISDLLKSKIDKYNSQKEIIKSKILESIQCINPKSKDREEIEKLEKLVNLFKKI